MTVFIALFRGINVGGHKKVKMDVLKKLHESLGFRDVRTYVQSGNVVFKSESADPAGIARRIESEFERAHGFPAKVILRTSGELREVVRKNPLQSQEGKEAKFLHVVFLAGRPENAATKEFLNNYHGPEELNAVGKELYIYYTNGAGRSKLTNALIEKKLKVPGTARNWNTVTKLLELAEA
jgi:uncharacterized protein (DUF1697 family)